MYVDLHMGFHCLVFWVSEDVDTRAQKTFEIRCKLGRQNRNNRSSMNAEPYHMTSRPEPMTNVLKTSHIVMTSARVLYLRPL